MNKKVPLEAYSEANALMNKYNVEALNSCMLGLPGETENNIKKTLDFLKDAKNVKQASFSIATPYPGTKLHEMAVNGQGGMELLSDDFTEYRRYGEAVINVNDLTANDLKRLQNEGYVSIYSKYWRWWPVVKRYGIMGLVFTLYRLLKMILLRIRYKIEKNSRLRPIRY